MRIKKLHFIYWTTSILFSLLIIFYYQTPNINILNVDYSTYEELVSIYDLNWTFFNDGDHYDYLTEAKKFFLQENSIQSFFEALKTGSIRNDIIISYFFYLFSPSINLILLTVWILNFLILTVLYHYNYHLLSISFVKKGFINVVFPFLLLSYFLPHINKEIFTLLFLFVAIYYLKKPKFLTLLFLVAICTTRLQFFIPLIPIIMFPYFKKLKLIYILTFFYFTLTSYFLVKLDFVHYDRIYLSKLINLYESFINMNFFIILNFFKQIFIFFNQYLLVDIFFSIKSIEKIILFVMSVHISILIITNLNNLRKKSFYLNSENRIILFIVYIYILTCAIHPISSPRYIFMMYPLILLSFEKFKKSTNN
ncbi:hypothetical protein OAP88_00745 [Candidatus Pelagibacter sp.]|nr:hypothetical protein [Candidatus Pelagibacter sp.]